MQQVLEHQIRERAYHLWIASGRNGAAEQHWLAAEREVLAMHATAVPAKPRRAPARRKSAPRADAA